MEIKDVENLAELARIELSEEEKGDLLKDMQGILEYVKQIEGVKLDDVKAEYDLVNIWREDSPRLDQAGQVEPRDFSRDLIFKQFPDSRDGFLKVKKIL
ncbi:MAG: Asp-tRNA(Asn)/Glu-tRNA(Gln) amidotransferase subunit GatC [Candidatus Paceibacterota bacterium]|jgi:aspartyl-tRNA(Asn)/glutamyl-tRNA(Gln) amidotransferase subunit C